MLHVLFPRQAIFSVHHIMHESIGTIPGSALDSDIGPMTQLVNVVFHTPSESSFSDKIWANFARNNLIRSAATFNQNGSIEVAKHTLAHAIEISIASAHADICS